MTVAQENAETLALQCLGWIAGRDDLVGVFMGSTGATQADLRDRAQDPVFLAAVLDFLLLDDAWVIEFCAGAGLANDAPMRARAALPGGAQIDWS